MANIENAFTNQGTLSGLAQGLGEQLIDSALGSLSPLNNFGRYLTGSRAIIKVNDKLFGFAFGVTFNVNTIQEEVWTIDDWTPYELAPQRIEVEGTLSMFHVPGKGPTRELIQANVLSFLFHRYITIRIEDQTTGQKIFETRKAAITSRREVIRAGEIATIELTWKAIGWIDELSPNYPDGYAGPDSEGNNSLGGIASAIGSLF